MMMLLLIELVLVTLTIPLWVPLICAAGENYDIDMDKAVCGAKMMNFVLKSRTCVSKSRKTRNCVPKSRKNEKSCIKNDDFAAAASVKDCTTLKLENRSQILDLTDDPVRFVH